MRCCSPFFMDVQGGMKMLKRVWLAAAVLLMLLAAEARAELMLPYGADTVVSVRNLTGTQRALGAYLYPYLMSSGEKIALPEGTRYDDAAAVMNALMQDCPELFHLHSRYSLTYEKSRPEIALAVTPQYRMDAAQTLSVRRELYAAAQELLSRCQTAEELHDALLTSCTYRNMEALDHTAVGALLLGYANCEGYAQALTLLYRMAGIPCGVVIGDAADASGLVQRHAWNIADLGGYTLVDAAWNDQDGAGVNTHWYYGLSDAQMARDHTPDGDQRLPECTGGANWHRLHGWQVSTLQEAYAAVRAMVRQGGVMNVRFTDEMLYARVAGDLYGFLGGYNEAAPEDAFYGGYSGMSNDAQMCLMLWRVE